MNVSTYQFPSYCINCQAPIIVHSTGDEAEHDCGECGVVRLGVVLEGDCARCGRRTAVHLVIEGPDGAE
jgi:hypothetical protein